MRILGKELAPTTKLGALRPGLWMLPVSVLLSLYLYRPFVLGFYSDDWGMLVETTRYGGPFSIERLSYAWQTFARPLMNLEVWLASSVFGSSTVAWHFFLLALAAVSYIMLRRLLLELGARPAVATIASTAWLLFPWALGYRVWPICSAVLMSTIFFLAGSTALLRKRLWPALAWYAASLLMYEAFYFAFLPFLFILAMSPTSRRWALYRAAPLLISLQILLVAINRVAAHFSPTLGKSYDPGWYLHLANSIFRLPFSLSDGVAGPRLFSFVIVGCVLLVGLAAALMTRHRDRRVKLGAAVMGFVLACFVLAVADYELSALNILSRTFVSVDVWLAVFFAVALSEATATRRVKWVAGVGVVVVMFVFAASTVVRTDLWHRLWDAETTILESVPAGLETTGAEAVIVFCDTPTVDGVLPFPGPGAMYNAVANRPTGLRILRNFYPAGPGHVVAWDGERLMAGGTPIFEAKEVWVWRWPDRFEQITSPRTITNSRGQYIGDGSY